MTAAAAAALVGSDVEDLFAKTVLLGDLHHGVVGVAVSSGKAAEGNYARNGRKRDKIRLKRAY